MSDPLELDAATSAAAQAASAMASLQISNSKKKNSRSGAARTPSARKGSLTVDPTVERKLAKAVYVCISKFNRSAIATAFEDAQHADGLTGNEIQHAKAELHVTLWHKNSNSQQHGYICVSSENTSISFEVTGFYFSSKVSAAKVEFTEDEMLRVGGCIQGVTSPHVTMWCAKGVPPKDAGKLQQKEKDGSPDIRFLPLSEPLTLVGRVTVR